MRLVLGPIIRSDHAVQIAVEPEQPQSLHGRIMALRSDDAERIPLGAQLVERFFDASERTHHAIVLDGVVFAIHAEQFVMKFPIAREIPHLHREGLADLGHEALGGNILPKHRLHRMLHRFENEIVRIEQSPIKIE